VRESSITSLPTFAVRQSTRPQRACEHFSTHTLCACVRSGICNPASIGSSLSCRSTPALNRLNGVDAPARPILRSSPRFVRRSDGNRTAHIPEPTAIPYGGQDKATRFGATQVSSGSSTQLSDALLHVVHGLITSSLQIHMSQFHPQPPSHHPGPGQPANLHPPRTGDLAKSVLEQCERAVVISTTRPGRSTIEFTRDFSDSQKDTAQAWQDVDSHQRRPTMATETRRMVKTNAISSSP